MTSREGGTFSGGEPLLQPEFLIAMLEEFGSRSIHRTVDTTGLAASETLLKVAKHTDLFLYDLKMMDSGRHKKWTGVGNEQIHRNLQLLAATGASINIRIPIVKDVNDDKENITQTAVFVASLAGEKKKVNILPYHNIAANKYLKLGEQYHSAEMAEPSEEEKAGVVTRFADFGLKVEVGG